jgi:TPR repeat protein
MRPPIRLSILGLSAGLLWFAASPPAGAVPAAPAARPPEGSCERGDPRVCVDQGVRAEKAGDLKEARRLLTIGCNRGQEEGCRRLAPVLVQSGEVDKAKLLLGRLCEKGEIDPCAMLAGLHEKENDIEAAEKLYGFICKNRPADAGCLRMAEMYDRLGHKVKARRTWVTYCEASNDYKRCIEVYQKWCSDGDQYACRSLMDIKG